MPKEKENPIEAFLKETSPLVDKEIETVIPRSFSDAWMAKTFGTPRFAYDGNSLTHALSEPLWDLLDRGGKRWRPVLLILSCEAVGGKKELALRFTPIIEVIHNGTLVADDIEDNSQTRRGKPCLHLSYGIDIAINAGNAAYYLPLNLLLSNPHHLDEKKRLKLHELVVQELLNCHVGQGMDIFWHKGKKTGIQEKEYLQMCAYKTGTLARLAAKIGCVLGNGSEKQLVTLGTFAETIGVAFQIQDDILNLVGEEFQKGKGVGEDIHEGKRTLMVLHAFENANLKEKKRLEEILNSHPSDEKTIREAISILQKNGSINYARKRARELVEEAWKQLDPVLSASNAKKMLNEFARYLIERQI